MGERTLEKQICALWCQLWPSHHSRYWPQNATEAGGGRGVRFHISISDVKPQEPEMFA